MRPSTSSNKLSLVPTSREGVNTMSGTLRSSWASNRGATTALWSEVKGNATHILWFEQVLRCYYKACEHRFIALPGAEHCHLRCYYKSSMLIHLLAPCKVFIDTFYTSPVWNYSKTYHTLHDSVCGRAHKQIGLSWIFQAVFFLPFELWVNKYSTFENQSWPNLLNQII